MVMEVGSMFNVGKGGAGGGGGAERWSWRTSSGLVYQSWVCTTLVSTFSAPASMMSEIDIILRRF